MKFIDWPWIKGLSGLLEARRLEPLQQARRIVAMQLHIVLPIKAGVIAVAFYYLLYPGWLQGLKVTTLRDVVLQSLQWYFLVYALCNAVAGLMWLFWRRFPPGIFQWLAFTLGLLDGLFVAGLMFNSGGFESTAYWVFPGLIVLNAASVPLATPQIVLNLLLSVFYVSAGILDAKLPPPELQIPALAFRQPGFVRPDFNPGNTNLTGAAQGTNRISGTHRPGRSLANDLPYISEPQEVITEPFLPRLFVLWLLTACCYGVQVLADRQRRVLEEEREFAVREAQLQTAGRLAAEIAHQLKNPLTIINNTVFSLQRAGKEGKPPAAGPIEIIQEEIGRADRILTDLMGYAQLAEGRVEKLNVVEELDQAIDDALPAAAGYRVQVERHYDSYFPPLLMQRRHLSEILVNLLQNAREALNGAGKVSVTAVCRPDYSVEIAVADNGPGVPPDKLEQIFEAYYTTKERGTGLGLAIVKHNVELYAGTVRVESELGNGARFVLVLPAKALINVTKRK